MEQKKENTPTSIDVAKRAGVSQISVSRVFNKEWENRVSDRLREKVMRAAQELGYTPNAIARGLNIRRTGIIGVVVSEDYSAFYQQVLNQLANEIQKHDMRVMLFNIAPDNDINQIIERLSQYQVDGVVITSAALVKVVSGRWTRKGLPVVVFNAYVPGLVCSSVYGDNFTAATQMARHLYETGKRRFAYVTAGNSLYTDHLQRKDGFLSGLADLGIHDCALADGDYSYESGRSVGRQLFSQSAPPDAVFCGGERMALGVMDAARLEFGLRIPEDVAVAGYDDTSAATLPFYDLTAVHQPVENLIHITVNLMLELIEQPSLTPRSICEPMRLIIRSSTVK